QELFGKGSLSSFSVEVPGHPHGHAGSQVQGNRRPRPKDAGLQIAQRFQQPLDVFDCLAVDAEDFVPLPACRKRKRVDSRLFGQELPQPLSPFLEQLLAERQRKVSQLVESRTDCDLQGIRFLPALEGLAATATVLGQRFGNKTGQSAEFEDLFVAASPLSIPKVLQPGVGQSEMENAPSGVCQGKLQKNRCGEEFVVHDDGSWDDSRDYQATTCDNLSSSSWEPQVSDSTAFVRGGQTVRQPEWTPEPPLVREWIPPNPP